MAGFEERKKFWNIFYSPLVFIILLVAFLFLARAAWRVFNHVRISSEERRQVEAELAAVSARESMLRAQVEVLETPKGVEDEIRSRFNVSKSGEGVAVIVESEQASSATSTPKSKKSWWRKVFGL